MHTLFLIDEDLPAEREITKEDIYNELTENLNEKRIEVCIINKI